MWRKPVDGKGATTDQGGWPKTSVAKGPTDRGMRIAVNPGSNQIQEIKEMQIKQPVLLRAGHTCSSL